MNKPHNLYNTLQKLPLNNNKLAYFYSLPQLEKAGFDNIARLPVSIRMILESVLRNYDEKTITIEHIKHIANWQPNASQREAIPFPVSRIILQDYTGIPLLIDLAAMRETINQLNLDPNMIQPQVPVSLIIDHSLQTNYTQRPDALQLNTQLEYKRNQERYQFIKWGHNAFKNLQIIPPGNGIVHQINLEYLATGVLCEKNIYYPDSVIGTDSHTTMINGIGVVGWGVGGIEAETRMLGQPISLLLPDVTGIHLSGTLPEGVTATDLVLTLTSLLRQFNVVNKFVEYFGEGVKTLSAPDRATIANMAPDYGATMGFFPIDDETLAYYKATGREEEQVELIHSYFKAQNLFGVPKMGDCHYSQIIEVDLSAIYPSVAGPKRPQDHIALDKIKYQFEKLLSDPFSKNGYNLDPSSVNKLHQLQDTQITHGDVLIAAITSCTNTSNPAVLLAAGILAKKAVAKGLKVKAHIKTSLTPGSFVVTDYLKKTNLLEPLEQLGFHVAGYGCATCNGNVGSLRPDIEQLLAKEDIIAASVLSGNRNFESRIHPTIRANFLMSPPLVIAFALAGSVRVDFYRDPLGYDNNNHPIYLKDIWPTIQEINDVMHYALQPELYHTAYKNMLNHDALWKNISTTDSMVYPWKETSTYIANPPFLKNFSLQAPSIHNIYNARALVILGDSITTDHISPVGNISADSPAGIYLQEKGVTKTAFNSYGSRRGHHDVMLRGTFSNPQLKNYMVPDMTGGFTRYYPDNTPMSIFAASMLYQDNKVPLIIFAGEEYGTGSSRDWAAKGTHLLGVRVVIANSIERIHCSNLIGMGVLPCRYKNKNESGSFTLKGDESFDIVGLDHIAKINPEIHLVIHYPDGATKTVELIAELKTQAEVDYFTQGGIQAYILRKIINDSQNV